MAESTDKGAVVLAARVAARRRWSRV